MLSSRSSPGAHLVLAGLVQRLHVRFLCLSMAEEAVPRRLEGRRVMARIGYDRRTWTTGNMSGATSASICSGTGGQARGRGQVVVEDQCGGGGAFRGFPARAGEVGLQVQARRHDAQTAASRCAGALLKSDGKQEGLFTLDPTHVSSAVDEQHLASVAVQAHVRLHHTDTFRGARKTQWLASALHSGAGLARPLSASEAMCSDGSGRARQGRTGRQGAFIDCERPSTRSGRTDCCHGLVEPQHSRVCALQAHAVLRPAVQPRCSYSSPAPRRGQQKRGQGLPSPAHGKPLPSRRSDAWQPLLAHRTMLCQLSSVREARGRAWQRQKTAGQLHRRQISSARSNENRYTAAALAARAAGCRLAGRLRSSGSTAARRHSSHSIRRFPKDVSPIPPRSVRNRTGRATTRLQTPNGSRRMEASQNSHQGCTLALSARLVRAMAHSDQARPCSFVALHLDTHSACPKRAGRPL